MPGSPKKRAKREALARGEQINQPPNFVHAVTYADMNAAREAWHAANPPYVAEPGQLTTRSAYDPAFCKRILEDAILGHSLGATCALIGCSRVALLEWSSRHPELANAIARAKEIRQRFYEGHFIDIVRRGGDSVRFSAVKMGLMNLGKDDWTEKVSTGMEDALSLASLIAESMKQPLRIEPAEPRDVTPKPDDEPKQD